MRTIARWSRIFSSAVVVALAASGVLAASAQAGISPPSASTTNPPQPGNTLFDTASTGSQWLQCSGSGTSCSPISGATSSSYQVQPGDVGYTIEVQDPTDKPPGGFQTSGPTLVVAPNSTSANLLTVPASAITNQPVTLVATITSSSGFTPPVGAVTFTAGGLPLGGCSNVPLTTTEQSANVTCQAAFSAGLSPAHLAAVFTPAAGSGNAGTTSPTINLTVAHGGSSTSLAIAKPKAGRGATAIYTATVAASAPGRFRPAGVVEFQDNGRPIPSCASRSLGPSQSGVIAQCQVRYQKSGSHGITARYLGDASFLGSASPRVKVNVHLLPLPIKGTIKSKTQWVFRFTPAYTRILSFVIHRAINGMNVRLRCRGTGCPFATWRETVAKSARCLGKAAPPCAQSRLSTVNLSRRLRKYRLRPGSVITVMFTRPQWIGKEYRFSIRAAHAPSVQILCVAPGAKRAGLGC